MTEKASIPAFEKFFGDRLDSGGKPMIPVTLNANTAVPTSLSNIPAIPNMGMELGPGSILTAVLSVAAGILVLRRKFFTDGNDISKGKTEAGLLVSMAEQIEVHKRDARDAWDQRAKDAAKMAKQETQIRNLYQTLALMTRVLKEVAPERAAMFDYLDNDTDNPISVSRKQV